MKVILLETGREKDGKVEDADAFVLSGSLVRALWGTASDLRRLVGILTRHGSVPEMTAPEQLRLMADAIDAINDGQAALAILDTAKRVDSDYRKGFTPPPAADPPRDGAGELV